MSGIKTRGGRAWHADSGVTSAGLARDAKNRDAKRGDGAAVGCGLYVRKLSKNNNLRNNRAITM